MIFPTGQLDVNGFLFQRSLRSLRISISLARIIVCLSMTPHLSQSINRFLISIGLAEKGEGLSYQQPLIGNDLMISSIMSICSGLFP